jgi:ABC-type nitrate/sulfonate/bicarbonate transport system substrate-binding protein
MDSFHYCGIMFARWQRRDRHAAIRRLALTSYLAVGGLLLLFSPALAQERLERVTLAVPVHALSQLPSYVGARFGLFREEGIDIQIIQMRTALVGPALISRDLDFGTAADTMLRAATTGLPVKVIAFGGVRPALALNVRPEIKRVEDLKGKMISVSSRGSTTDIVAREIVRRFGLNPDTDIVTMPLGTQTNQLVALKSNAVQASLFTPPYDAIAEREGLRALVWAGDLFKDQLQAGLTTSDQKIRANPDQVRRMVRGFVKSLIFLQKEKAKVAELIAKEWNIDLDLAQRSYKSTATTLSPDGSASEDAVRKVVEQTLATTKQQKQVPLSQVVDLSFLRRAHEELGIRQKP